MSTINRSLSDLRKEWKEIQSRFSDEFFSVAKNSKFCMSCHLMKPNIQVDDYGISTGRVSIPFSEIETNEAEHLVNAVNAGRVLSLSMDFVDGVPLLLIKSSDVGKDQGYTEAVIGNIPEVEGKNLETFASMPSLHLPEKIEKELLSTVLKYDFNEIFDSFMDYMQKQYAISFPNESSRQDILAEGIYRYYLGEEKFPPVRMLYYDTLFMSDKDLSAVKDKVFGFVSEFYDECLKEGAMTGDEHKSYIAFLRNELDSLFSSELRDTVRLDWQLDNVSKMYNEVTAHDIARIAVRAEKDPVLSPVVGERLEKWVSSVCKEYGVKKSVVNTVRQKLGGTINTSKAQRKPFSQKMKAKISSITK